MLASCVLCSRCAAQRDAQTPPQQPPPVSLHARAGAPVRRRSLSDGARGARAGQRVDRRRRASRKSAYLPRLDSLWQSNRGDGQQHLRPGAAAVGDPRDVRSGAAVGVRRQRLGQRRRARCSRGSRSTSACATPAVASAEAARGAGARRRSADAARRAERRRRARFSTSSARSGRSRRRRPMSIAATSWRARSHTLVDNQLRPGAEASRADAERAAAQTRLIQAQQAVDARRRSTLARVLGITTARVAIDAGDAARSRCRPMRRDAGARRRIRWRRSRQAAVDVARAQEDVLARTDRPRVYLQSSVFARGSGANPNGAARRRRSTASASTAPTGRPACRWCFPNAVRLLEPARAQGGGGAHRRAPRAALLRRGGPDGHEPAAGGGGDGRRRRARSPRTRRCSSPRRGRAKRRRARATRPAWRASSKSPTRRACSRRPKCRTSSRASTCGARCWRRRSAQGDLAPFLDAAAAVRGSPLTMWLIRAALRGPITVLVAVDRRRADGGVRRQPDAGRHLSRSRSAGHLRRAAVRRHEPGADGGVSSPTTTSTTSSTSTASRASSRSRSRTPAC